MNYRSLNAVFSGSFLLSLFILVVNDWYLKELYSNWITGKLSDFSGIFLLGLIVFSLFPKYVVSLGLAIGILFAYWKSPFSEPLINFINMYSPVMYGRVVDYTDLIALMMIPAAGYFSRSKEPFITKKTIQRVTGIPIILVTSFAIIATSQVPIKREYVEIRTKDSEARIELKKFIRIVKFIANKNKLACSPCDASKKYGTFVGDKLRLDYFIYDDNASASFEIFAVREGIAIQSQDMSKSEKALLAVFIKDIRQQFNDTKRFTKQPSHKVKADLKK